MHTLFLRDDGSVSVLGSTYGEVTTFSVSNERHRHFAGLAHDLALKRDGTIVAWGDLTNVPPGLTNVIAVAAGGYHNLALQRDGNVVAWETLRSMGKPMSLPG